MVEAPVKSVTAISASGVKTRAAGAYTFRYVLGVAPMPRAEIDIKATLGNELREAKIAMADPEYDIVVDAFARKVVLKVEGKDEAQTKQIRNHLTFYNNNAAVPTANVSHDASGLITITGLTPALFTRTSSQPMRRPASPSRLHHRDRDRPAQRRLLRNKPDAEHLAD